MSKNARDIHTLSATLRRLEHEAATGKCAICGAPSVGFIYQLDGIPFGICEGHAAAVPRCLTVHREA
jgi:hypothetical protein